MPSASEDHPAGRPGGRTPPRHKNGQGAGRKKPSRKLLSGKAAAWAGGLAGAAVLAFVTAYFSGLGSQAAAPSPSPSPVPRGSPVRVTVGNVTEVSASRVLPGPVSLDGRQLSRIDNAQDDTGADSASWFAMRQAALVGAADIQLVVQGNRHGPVQIVNITPVEKCYPPLHGTLFYAPSQGEEASAHLSVNLDEPQAPAGYTLPSSLIRRPDYFGHYTMRVIHAVA
jgi:hypothetical protein